MNDSTNPSGDWPRVPSLRSLRSPGAHLGRPPTMVPTVSPC